MYESFISDISIFSNDFNTYIDTRNRPAILYNIEQKHIGELKDAVPIDIKKDDLLIWNAILAKEIVRSGVAKKYLHPVYNKFYGNIKKCNDLIALQKLELSMANTYLELLISDVEVKDNFVVNKILQFLHMNIESHVTLDDIANHVNITPQYAVSCFKKHMGISLMKYSKKIRIDRAKVLLTTTTKSILEIALILGFYDQSHFTKTFKSFEGISPLEFRNTHYK